MSKISLIILLLLQQTFALNFPQVRFGLPEIEFLGFTVNASGITPMKSKLEAIAQIPPPQTQKKFLAFLGAISYYRHCHPPLKIEDQETKTVTN